jgi:uncharacterized membrane protein YfbV (UPF0208 family)
LASNHKIGDHWQYIIPKKQGLADALSEKQFLQTLLFWNDVLPVVANFVVTCQTKNLNILAAMTSFKKMIFALEVLRDQEGAFEQSFPEFQAQVASRC